MRCAILSVLRQAEGCNSCHNIVELDKIRFDSYTGYLHVPHIMLCILECMCVVKSKSCRSCKTPRAEFLRGVEPKNCAKSKECRLFKDAMVESPPIPAISKRANESRIGRCRILRSRRQSHDGEELRHRRPPEPSSSGPSESAIIAENRQAAEAR